MRTLAVTLLALAPGPPASAELPDLYRSVASVHWVVADLGAVRQGWEKLGFPPARDLGEVALSVTHRGTSGTARIRVAVADLAGLEVAWIEPVDDVGAFAEFRARHGSGIMSLNHRVSSLEEIDREVSRLGALGVGVLQRSDAGSRPVLPSTAYMDTGEKGRYVLGLVLGSAAGSASPGPKAPHGLTLSQLAFVARDLEAVSAFWRGLGFPAIEVTHGPLRDPVYRGQPGRFDQELGWQRHGSVVYEWVRPLAGPSVYDEFLESHGEGVHHLGFDVPDLDAALAAWTPLGFPPAQSGGWGEAGKKGSGRFAYVDTDPVGGALLELLWRQP